MNMEKALKRILLEQCDGCAEFFTDWKGYKKGDKIPGTCKPDCHDLAADGHPRNRHAGFSTEALPRGCKRCLPWGG